jgi:hypothetical protein
MTECAKDVRDLRSASSAGNLIVSRPAGTQLDHRAAQLNGSRQLALLLIDGADRGGIGFGNEEHSSREK